MLTAATVEAGRLVPGEEVDDAPAPVMAGWNGQPRVAPELVPRPRLVRALCEADASPVTTLVAPAGYGKTTLLVEWGRRDERPFAWITLDARDNEPRRLLASVRRALASAIDWNVGQPFVIVFDDAHAVREPLALAALATLAGDLPPHGKLVIASRTQPSLPIARMRADRGVTELGPRELAMTRAEASALVRAGRHEVGRAEVEALLARTEGWPVALSLASVYLGAHGAGALKRFGGGDRLVRQYVRDEVLAGLDDDRRRFMLETSVAGTLTAPLCDTLTGGDGSALTLAALAREGLVVPLDRSDERFRHHRLLSESLRAELRATAPRRERELHRRAAVWHRDAGEVEYAIDHAVSAGDLAEAADVLWANLARAVAEGRASTVERWLARFMSGEVAEHPRLAVTAAGCALLRGQGHMAAHWIGAAAAAVESNRDDDAAVAAGIAILRMALAGADEQPAPAATPERERSCDAAGRALRSLIAGMARYSQGDLDGAATALEAGVRHAAVSAPAIHALCLAELAVLALGEGDWEHASALITRGRAQVDRYALADQASMALVFAVSALVRANRGRVDAAHSDLRDAVRLQGLFVDVAPATDAHVGLMVAHAALRMGDVGLAREQLASATRLLRRLPGALALHECAAEAAARLDAFARSADATPGSITAAELRILQHLPTHLSFREIGKVTHVSANTVKTQANAVYRKLAVSSRSDAVARARECGLLDGV